MADPYATLGVAREATEKDIKSAYRKLAKELHPDRNKDNPRAAERFSDVTKAYDLLSDTDKRARFDRGEIDADGNPARPFGGGGQAGGFRNGSRTQRGFSAQDFDGFGAEGIDLGDIFDGLFGGARAGTASMRRPQPPPRRGADIRYRLQVPFVDAASMRDQRITLSDGKTIDLKLPPGVDTGTQMRLKGKGSQGPGGAGDGLVEIEVLPHPFFRRDGNDVRLDLPVTLDEAVNGAKVKVPTVEGPVMLTIAPGSSSGQALRLKGRGFVGKNGQRGDQLATLEIVLPADPEELARRLEGWTDGRNVRSRLDV